MTEASDQALRRVPFDERFLVASAEWLIDSEMANLIMTPVFSLEGQRRWFESLSSREDYAVWGIEFEGRPIGVLGLKNIGVYAGAEYFFYIGDREYWGRGIASWAYSEVSSEARHRGLRFLFGIIGKHNGRSLFVHQRLGMRITLDMGDRYFVASDLIGESEG